MKRNWVSYEEHAEAVLALVVAFRRRKNEQRRLVSGLWAAHLETRLHAKLNSMLNVSAYSDRG